MKRFSSFSVRARITAAVALLTALAMAGAGFTVYVVELRRLDRVIERDMTQEIGEFRALQDEGEDPRTGQPFASADRLLTVFLERNLPAQNEILFAFPTTGRVKVQGTVDEGLERSREFAETVADLKQAGGTRAIETGGDRYVVAVQPVRDGANQAAFVVTHNVSKSRAELRNVIATYALVAFLSLLVVTFLASRLAGQLLRPVRRLRETTQQISGGDLSQRIETSGNDDLTELTTTVNQMLDRLESAFATQRQLLDDAGHELRTPLTILRGHLELLDETDPTEVTTTRELLLDEIDRMSRLVDDLLMLAKARRPDFIQAEPVDLSFLTSDVLQKCRALGPRDWVLDAAAPATAVVDAQRLTQALLQLAHNAVRQTADGDEIAIGSRVNGDLIELWVRDTGPGVPYADRERVFQRFQRGSAAGGDDGFGLGLSIVSAIAAAHGGSVLLDEPGADTAPAGALFRIVVPNTGTRRQPLDKAEA